jgi:hypothetical protein
VGSGDLKACRREPKGRSGSRSRWIVGFVVDRPVFIRDAAVNDTASTAGGTGSGHPPGKSGPRRAKTLAHAHPAVQECDRFHRQRRGLFRNHELRSSAAQAPATPGNALASAVTAARMRTTTPANSGVISYSSEHVVGAEVLLDDVTGVPALRPVIGGLPTRSPTPSARSIPCAVRRKHNILTLSLRAPEAIW